ncbi:MAG: sigma 54-interacting transcriptional regulator [candidate division Zixibacteria bacterium]|nr:sigma 54-interacting transcriptional regulator [candidate division Zixibacteria bacterium]
MDNERQPVTALVRQLEAVEVLVEKREYLKAKAELAELVNTFRPVPHTAEWAHLSYLEALVGQAVGDFAWARQKAAEAYEFFKNTGEHRHTAQIQYVFGLIETAQGNLKEAEQQLKEAVFGFRRAADLAGAVDALSRLARVYCIIFDFQRACEVLAEGMELAHRLGDARRTAWLGANEGRILLLLGDWNTAIERFNTARSSDLEQGDDLNLSKDLLSLGYAYLCKGDYAVAERYLNEAYAKIIASSAMWELGIWYEYAGELKAVRGDYEGAEELYLKGVELSERIAPESALVSQTYRLYAELMVLRNDFERARRFAQTAYAVATRLGERIEIGALLRVFGRTTAAAGDFVESRRYFTESIALLKDLKVRRELFLTYLEAIQSGSFSLEEVAGFLARAVRLAEGLKSGRMVKEAQKAAARVFEARGALDLALGVWVGMKTDTEAESKILELEEKLAARATSSENEYRLFRLVTSDPTGEEAFKKGDIEGLLRFLEKKTGTSRVALLAQKSRDEKTSFWGLGIDEKEVGEKVLNPETSELKSEKPALFIGGEEKVASFITVPFQPSGYRYAVLFLERGPASERPVFLEKEFCFAVAFADLAAFKLLEKDHAELAATTQKLLSQLEESAVFPNIITRSEGMQRTLSRLEQVKDSDLPILLEGETGTGKDLLAKAIHYSSTRKKGHFVAVNCAALPESILESELFGHKKGAFTGALADKIGLLEEADGGTLYLDEVAEIPLSMQVKLLRILEEKEFFRLGETRPRKIDIRIISATNRDVKAQVSAGLFRKDLYYRLNTINVTLPPLRERREDISLLVDYLLKRAAEQAHRPVPTLSPEVLRFLFAYDYPGNVRELANELSRLVALAPPSGVATKEILSEKFFPRPTGSSLDWDGSLEERVCLFEKEEIVRALESARFVKAQAARILGVPVSTLRYKMEKYGIADTE